MQTNRQELAQSVRRRLHRGRKATGRIAVSAIGFALAYYFDPENGEVRRKQLHQTTRRTVNHFKAASAPNVGDPVVFPPLRTHRAVETERRPTEPVEVAR